MQDIKQRELKMQEKRKHTSRKDFVMGICSWFPMIFYKNNGIISRYPETKRITEILKSKDFENSRDGLINTASLLES